MSYRIMRVIVFFDLPVETAENRRAYSSFRKMLIKNGFFMMQQSVYTRMLLTPTGQQSVVDIIKKNKPKEGIVQILTITEKQFSSIECITGEFTTDVLNSDERLVVL